MRALTKSLQEQGRFSYHRPWTPNRATADSLNMDPEGYRMADISNKTMNEARYAKVCRERAWFGYRMKEDEKRTEQFHLAETLQSV